MSVENVGSHSVKFKLSFITRESTLEKNPMSVRSVGKLSEDARILPNTRKYMPKENISSDMCGEGILEAFGCIKGYSKSNSSYVAIEVLKKEVHHCTQASEVTFPLSLFRIQLHNS